MALARHLAGPAARVSRPTARVARPFMRGMASQGVAADEAALRPSSMAGTIGALLDAQVNKNHFKRAMRVEDQDASRWSYGELKRQVEALAIGMSKLGLVSGDKMAVALPTSAESVTLLLACAKLGIAVMPLPTTACDDLTAVARKYAAALDSGVAAIVIPDVVGDVDHAMVLGELVPELESTSVECGESLVSSQYPALKCVINTGPVRKEGMIRFQWISCYSFDSGKARMDASVNEKTPFLITGSKTLTHGEMVAMGSNGVAKELGPDSIIAVASGLDTAPGFSQGVIAPLIKGAMSVFMRNPASIPKVMANDEPNVLVTGPEGVGEVGSGAPSVVCVVGATNEQQAAAKASFSSSKVVMA